MSTTLAAIQLREVISALTCAVITLETARAQLNDPVAARHVSIAITDAENARLRTECAIRGLQQRVLATGPEFGA